MTTQECAVVMAYTGVAMLTGDNLGEFYRYVEHLLGYPVMTHELASEVLWAEIKRRSKVDFLALCGNRSDDVVTVIRCRDCALGHRHGDEWCACDNNVWEDHLYPADFYCAYGKRRGDDDGF